MAAAVVELGAEGAEALAPEIAEVGAEAAPKLEEFGSKAAEKVEHLFGKKAAAAAAKPAGRQTMDRLMDVGTGVMIGQSLQGSDPGTKAAQGVAQTLAATQAPPGATPAAGAETRGGSSLHEPHHGGYAATGGGAPPVVVQHPRSLAESFRIALLAVLALLAIAATITILVKKPGSAASFGGGMALGAVTGASLYWAARPPRA